jgi:hypothetical protein
VPTIHQKALKGRNKKAVGDSLRRKGRNQKAIGANLLQKKPNQKANKNTAQTASTPKIPTTHIFYYFCPNKKKLTLNH